MKVTHILKCVNKPVVPRDLWHLSKSNLKHYSDYMQENDPIALYIHFNREAGSFATQTIRAHISDVSDKGRISWCSDTFSLNVADCDLTWHWSKFVDSSKASFRDCQGYFEAEERPSELLNTCAALLHFGATCTAFPVALGKDHLVYIEGDPLEYVVQYCNSEDGHIFCAVKAPFIALYHNDPPYSVTWKVYDDRASVRAFRPLAFQTEVLVTRELSASYYAAMFNLPITGYFLKRYSELAQGQFMMNFKGKATNLIRFPSSQVSSLIRCVSYSRVQAEAFLGVMTGSTIAFQHVYARATVSRLMWTHLEREDFSNAHSYVHLYGAVHSNTFTGIAAVYWMLESDIVSDQEAAIEKLTEMIKNESAFTRADLHPDLPFDMKARYQWRIEF